ncbi:MAG: helix-turn-helix transcriptional regulator [Gammaproteobacteria bacterium]|jgi:DNA-binding XRE family transcriptional regulator
MQVNLKNQELERASFSGTLEHKQNPAANIWVVLLAELYEMGFSQKTIAEESNISIPTLKRLEKNRVCPSPATFSKLLAFYCSVATAA